MTSNQFRLSALAVSILAITATPAVFAAGDAASGLAPFATGLNYFLGASGGATGVGNAGGGTTIVGSISVRRYEVVHRVTH